MPRGTPPKLDSFLRNLSPACFPHPHSGKGAEGRPSSTVFVLHGCGSLGRSPPLPHLGLSSSSLCSAPLHLVSPTTSLRDLCCLPAFFLAFSFALTPSLTKHSGRRGCVTLLSIYGLRGEGVQWWTLLTSAEAEVARCHVCNSVSVPPRARLSHPLPLGISLPAFVSFLPPFLSLLSSLGALCSCHLFVSASLLPLLPLPARKNCDLNGISVSGVWGTVEVGVVWAPSMPSNDSNHFPLPRVIIHIDEIDEIERTNTRMWGYGWQGKAAPLPGATSLPGHA